MTGYRIPAADRSSDWRHTAACLDEDPELFYPIGATGPSVQQVQDAKRVCRRCPVVEACLRFAIDQSQEYGVWGGMSEDERRSLKRREARGRRPQPQMILADGTSASVTRAMKAGRKIGQIAEAAGISPSTVRSLSRGEQQQVQLDVAAAIARALGEPVPEAVHA